MSTARSFRLPRGAERYILLQRTSYGFRTERLRRSRVQRLNDRYASSAVERARRPVIARRYATELAADYEELRPFLPVSANAVLDVGAGIGGIDVLLYRHYARSGLPPRISLLDREGVSEVFYGFRDQAAHHNSLDLAGEFLTLNGVPAAQVESIDVDRVGFPVEARYDLIVSLLSGGHHYPVSTYLDDVERSLSDGGVLILDVRHDSGGEEVLRERFTQLEPVRKGRVSTRLALTR